MLWLLRWRGIGKGVTLPDACVLAQCSGMRPFVSHDPHRLFVVRKTYWSDECLHSQFFGEAQLRFVDNFLQT
jgi:hypothetical protein